MRGEGDVRRRAVGRFGDALLTLAAVAGALCIALAVAAALFRVSVVLFSTGSMSPELPAGAIAIVREIPATDVRVGDIVTIDRPGRLPITHRVVSLADQQDGWVELTLRGDANTEVDPAPYLVSQVRLVVAGVPGGAEIVAALSSPAFLGPATLAASALVAWAFWPRRSRGSTAVEVSDAECLAAGLSERDGVTAAARSGPRHRAGAGTALTVIAVLSGTLLVPPAPAVGAQDVAAQDVATTAAATVAATTSAAVTSLSPDAMPASGLRLRSLTDSGEMIELRPGVPVRWIVAATASLPASTIVHLGLSAHGTLASTLTVSVVACRSPLPSSGSCPGETVQFLGATRADALPTDAPLPIGRLAPTGNLWLNVEVMLAPSGAELPSGQAALTVRAWGAGEEASVSTRPTTLASTGSGSSSAPLLLAASALIAGLAIAGIARLRLLGRRT